MQYFGLGDLTELPALPENIDPDAEEASKEPPEEPNEGEVESDKLEVESEQ